MEIRDIQGLVLPSGKRSITTSFVFKIKRAADGTVERYESHLVTRGFTRRMGIDFFEMLSPVVGVETMWTTLADSALQGWKAGALDFKKAYLNGKLS